MEPLANVQLAINELSIRNNGLPPGEFIVSPRFTRNIGVVSENVSCVNLIVEIVNTPEIPFPFDIKADLMGVFELSKIPEHERDYFLKITAVQVLLPYVRGIVSSVTANTFMPPVILPIVDVHELFPDDSAS